MLLLAATLTQYVHCAPKPKQQDKAKLLAAKVKRIRFNSERYMVWWQGHEAQSIYNSFNYAEYNKIEHNITSQHAMITAIFEDDLVRHQPDGYRYLIDYYASLRGTFKEDIVTAVPTTVPMALKKALLDNHIITYTIPSTLCYQRITSTVCGVDENVIPASLFKFYFYEIWALKYYRTIIMIRDFSPSLPFTTNPFTQGLLKYLESYQLLCSASSTAIQKINKGAMEKCYSEPDLRNVSTRFTVDGSQIIGTRDSIVVLAHSLTMQIQELLERVDAMASKGCLVENVDKVFLQYLVFSKRLRKYMRLKILGPGNDGRSS